MSLPVPGNLGNAPVWENYAIAQTVAASRGQIPAHTLAFGVEVVGSRLALRFQVSEITKGDEDDIEEILSELEALVGDEIEVTASYEVRDQREISPDDGVSWIFLARL